VTAVKCLSIIFEGRESKRERKREKNTGKKNCCDENTVSET